MALQAYLDATNRLLQNPVPSNPLYTTAALTAYINEARQQLAAEAECIRVLATASLSNSQQSYAFSAFTASLNLSTSGIASVLSLCQLAVTSPGATVPTLMTNRPWPWFNRYNLAPGGAALARGVPSTWAQLGRAVGGTFYVSGIPNNSMQVTGDVMCLPVDLVTDLTAEAIPSPFTTAIAYYAAYKAYLSSQRTPDATAMFNRYREYVARAIQQNTSTVLPMNQPGGMGAQIAAAKQAVTGAPGGGQAGGQR